MIHTIADQELETFVALKSIVEALDKRFPNGNSAFQRVSRLAEECGELASAVNHKENMGIKSQKHGEANDENLVKELQDVLRSTLGIARHYGLEDKLEKSIEDFYRSYQRDGLIN
ncbi:MAG TPA: MazG nucleotide pyrophosphohydrolase domain-containing protein [Candidatus Saccharimonadales bacterium]|nr:MazG nucleotide pyrophosphohydrolase domain-containing protein [Candidatus Saccharimonadales bacterium]